MVLCATEHEEFGGKKCVTASQLLKFAQMAMNKYTGKSLSEALLFAENGENML